MKMMLALLALIPIQAQAADEVTIETFESRAIGSGSFNIHNSAFMFNTRLSGGQVAAAMPASAAHSGVQVYTGTSIGLRTEDKTLFSWPGVGAWVSGVDTIWLQAYEYDRAGECARFGVGRRRRGPCLSLHWLIRRAPLHYVGHLLFR
jgi:hypothetical protein